MESRDTRDIILQTTFYLLLKKGYDGVSISDIQKKTGMARGLLYHYFGSKQQLLNEAAEFYLTKMFYINPEVIKDFTIPELINYLMEKYENIHSNAGLNTSEKISLANYDFLIYRMTMEEKVIADRYRKLREQESQAWLTAVKNSSRQNKIKSNMSPEQIAGYFVCITDGVWMQVINQNQDSNLSKQLKNMLEGFYSIIKT